MSEVRVRFTVGEFEMAIAARRRRRQEEDVLRRVRTAFHRLVLPPVSDPGDDRSAAVPTVEDFMVSPARRLADAVASAAVIRDVAALGALVLFGTMLAVVLSSADFIV